MTAPKTPVLERARADLDAGRPDLARDRVTGALAALHKKGEYSEPAHALLGEIHFAMRDYSRAGAAWLLTERHDDDALKAFEAFRARYGDDPVNILQALKPRLPLEKYPQTVADRLAALHYVYYAPGTRRQSEDNAPVAPGALRGRDMGCVAGLLFIVAIVVYYIVMTLAGRMR